MSDSVKIDNMSALSEYQRYLYMRPKLTYLFFELTDQCNLNCQHCGSRCTKKNDNFLSFAAIKKTLESVAERYEPKNIMVCLTGGEPFLHPDLYKIIYLAHELRFSVGITSNGTLIDKEKAFFLTLSGLDTITISLDGIGKVHDDFRGMEGSFDNAVRGIHALKRVGIEPEVLTVVHKKNLSQLDLIYHFMKKEGIFWWRLTNVDPIGRAMANQCSLLSGEELRQMFDFIREKRYKIDSIMEVTYGCSHFLAFDYENAVRDYYFQCGAGLQVAGVMANGDIGACLDIERRADLIQGNIYKDNFIDVWEERYEVFSRDRTQNSAVCGTCEYRTYCMGDSCHTWDYDLNEPRYCVVRIMRGKAI